MQQTANGYTATGATSPSSKNALGYWVYGQYYFVPDWAIVARYDSYDPNTASDNAAKGDSRNYALGGLVYKPDARVFISPNIVYESVRNSRRRSLNKGVSDRPSDVLVHLSLITYSSSPSKQKEFKK